MPINSPKMVVKVRYPHGIKNYGIYLQQQGPKIYEEAVRRASHTVAAVWKKEFRRQIEAPKHGRTSTVNGRSHTSSAPGETAARRTGGYKESIKTEVTGSNYLYLYSRDPKARFLEEGTDNMAPRPGFKNTIDATETETYRIYNINIYDYMDNKL